jgi:hypothetical protein
MVEISLAALAWKAVPKRNIAATAITATRDRSGATNTSFTVILKTLPVDICASAQS